jgi:hypothetical protein
MKSVTNSFHCCQRSSFTQKWRSIIRHVAQFAAILIVSTAAYAQYAGGGVVPGTPTTSGTYTPGSTTYGKGKAIGIGVGAAAAGVGAIYFITHRSSKITGCVERADDGLHFTDDKTQRTLALVPGKSDIKPGERLELKGKVKKNATGQQNFLVKAVAKDLGSCPASASAAPEIPLQQR